MKLFRVLTLALSLTMLFAACKREAAIVANNNPLEQPTLGDQVKPLDQKLIEPKIRAFQALLEESKNGTSSRTITTIQAQELVDNIEMLLNYSHANAARTGSDMVHKKDSFRLQNVNGLVDAQDIYAVYREVNNLAFDQYTSINDNSKNLLLVDVSVKNGSGGNTWVDVDTYTAKALGNGSYHNFGLDWKWGDPYTLRGVQIDEGTCDGSTLISDAAKELQNTINRRYPNAQRYYYNNLTYPRVFRSDIRNNYLLNPNDISTTDNIRDGLLFYQDEYYSNYSHCISASDMSWYYSNIYSLITSYIPQDGSNRQFAVCNVYGLHSCACLDDYRIFHQLEIVYGTPYGGCRDCPEPAPIGRIAL